MKRSIKGIARKILASALSAAMVVAFAPAVAWAEGEDTTSASAITSVVSKQITVTDDTSWNSAVEDITSSESSNLQIEITAAGTYTTNFSIPGSKTITITGSDGVVLNGQIAMLASDGRGGKTPGSLTIKSLTYNVDDTINYSITNISQTGSSGIALWGDQSVICENVLFNMTKNDSTAISGWWDTGSGTSITVKNCTFNCNGQRPIRACNNVTVESCIFNDPYRYAVQLTAKSSTAEQVDKAVVNFTNNSINNGANGKEFVYGVQLEGSDYGCYDLIINGSGNSINAGGWDTGNKSAMYYCECGKVDHASIAWNTEVAPVHEDAESFSPVATANGIECSNLADAVSKVAANGTVRLVADVTLTDTLTIGEGKNITLDLAGKTITGAQVAKQAIVNNGTLTIKDSSADHSGVITRNDTSSISHYVIDNQGILTLESGTITNKSLKEEGKGSSTIRNAGAGKAATLNIKGGSVNHDKFIAVKNDDLGVLNITGGIISTTGSNEEHTYSAVQNWGDASITGGNIGIVWTGTWSDSYKAKTTIGGNAVVSGPFVVKQDSSYSNPDNLPVLEIIGGTFYVDPHDYLADGYEASKSADVWTVAKKTVPVPTPDPTPVTPPTPPAEVGDKTEGVAIPSTPGEDGSTGGSTTVDITVTDNTATTDSKGNKVDGTVSIDKIESTESSVSIPETITTKEGTFLVTSIPAEAMKDNTTVESVTIPSSVVSIGESAFAGCTELISVTVPAGVTEIKDSTFAGCTNLATVEVQGEVTAIAPSAFEGCTALTNINVPETVTAIGESAFAGCTSLTSVSVPAGVATIEANTFANCTSLETVEVKGEITEIAADAFNGCSSLTSMTVAGTVKPMALGTLTTNSSLVIPASVVKVGDRAFKGTGITSATVPAGVKMGSAVFRDCKQLTKASVEKGVKTLSSYTFKGCSALKTVTVPSTVTKLERSVFSGCKNLAKVTLPKSVTSIGKNALYGASKAKTLTINSKKLTKSGVKGSLKGSSVTTVKVPASKVAAYKKIFTRANCGKTVKVRAI